jgi:hypothetical protein
MIDRPAVYLVINHVLESLVVGWAQEDLFIVYTVHATVHEVYSVVSTAACSIYFVNLH